MLAWVAIDRTYLRQFLPKSSSPRTLCLCVEFSDSFRPTSVVPTTYALPRATAAPQPLCNQPVTHSFYLDGGWIPPVALPSRQRSLECLSHVPYLLYFQSRAHSFALFCTPQNLNPFIFKRFRTLRQKTRGWGEWVPQRSASSCSVLANSARSKWATLFAARHASHQSPITSSWSPSICTRLQEC